MTREEAIRILDPETTVEALAEIEYYNGFSGKTAAVQAVTDACILAVAALREKEKSRWIPVTERFPDLELVYAKSNGFDLYVCLVTVKNLIAKRGRYVKKAWYDEYGFIDEDYVDITYDVTHWMPLPKPPKEETGC